MPSHDTVQLRVLNADDVEILKSIRLKALSLHPGYFMSKFETAKTAPDSYWLETLDGQGKCVWGLFDGDQVIGLTAVFTWREDPSGQSGVMAMNYIEPEYRGQGYSDLFYKARIEFAVHHKSWHVLEIGHRKGNDPSRHAMIKHGFKFYKTEEVEWPDGEIDTEYCYRLDLNILRSLQG